VNEQREKRRARIEAARQLERARADLAVQVERGASAVMLEVLLAQVERMRRAYEAAGLDADDEG
jgi:hypothetical protein